MENNQQIPQHILDEIDKLYVPVKSSDYKSLAAFDIAFDARQELRFAAQYGAKLALLQSSSGKCREALERITKLKQKDLDGESWYDRLTEAISIAGEALALDSREEQEGKENKKSISEAFRQLRELDSGWNNVICVCRGLMKDDPCQCNCKEFHDEKLQNYYSP